MGREAKLQDGRGFWSVLFQVKQKVKHWVCHIDPASLETLHGFLEDTASRYPMSHHGEHQMNRTLKGKKKNQPNNVISSFPKTPSFFTLWRKKDQPRRKWNREEFVWYASYFSTAILLSIWKMYSLCSANISTNLSKTQCLWEGGTHKVSKTKRHSTK